MKNSCLLAFLLCIYLQSFAQSVVHGHVFDSPNCQVSGTKENLQGATVNAPGAAQTVTTGPNGFFTLEFPNKKVGELVTITVVTRTSVQLVRHVNTSSPSGSKIPFMLCNGKPVTSAGDVVVRQTQKSLEEKNKEVADLKIKLANAEKDSKEYKDLFKKLETLNKEIKEQLDERNLETSALRAEREWDQTSKRILSNFGNSDALELPEEPKEGIITEEYLDSFRILWEVNFTADPSLTPEQARHNKMIREAEIKGKLFSLDGQYDKSELYYKKLANAVPDNLEYIYGYVEALVFQKKDSEAIAQIEKTLASKLENDLNCVKLSVLLARLYLINKQPSNSERALEKGFVFYNAIKKDTSSYVKKKVLEASMEELYGTLHYTQNEFDKAIAKYSKAREIYVNLQKETKGEYRDDVANKNIKIASVNSTIKNYNEALNYLNQSMAIYSDFEQSDNDEYTLEKYKVALTIAGLYYLRNDFRSAEELYSKLSGVFAQLSIDFPGQFDEFVAKILIAQGQMMHDQKEFALATEKFGEALEIYKKMNGRDGDFNAQVASVLNARGSSLFAQRKLERSKKDFDAAYQINVALAKKWKELYSLNLSDSYSHLGSYYMSFENKLDSAGYYFTQALAISQDFDRKDKRAYRLSLIQDKQHMASYLFRKGDKNPGMKEQARKHMDEAYIMAKDLVKLDSAVFLPDYCKTVMSHGMVYMDEKEPDIAIKKFEEAAEKFLRLSTQQPDVYEKPKATIQWALGTIYNYQHKDELAMKHLDQSIAICQKQLVKNENAYAPILANVYLSKSDIHTRNRRYKESLKNLEEAEKWLERLLTNTNLDHYRYELGNVKIQQAQINIIEKDYDRAEREANEGRQHFNDLINNDPENADLYLAKLAKIESGTAELNLGRNRKPESLANYRRANNYYKRLRKVNFPQFHIEECKTRLSIANLQKGMDQKPAALQECRSVIDTVLRIVLSNPTLEQDYLPVLARVYAVLGSLNFVDAPMEALENYKKSTGYYEKIKSEGESEESDQMNIAFNYLSIGTIHYNLKQPQAVISNLRTSLLYGQKHPSSEAYHRLVISAHSMLGLANIQTQDYDAAAIEYTECLKLEAHFKKFMEPIEILDLKMKAGESLLRSSDSTKNPKGEEVLKQARSFANRETWSDKIQPQINEYLKDICELIECN